jgi:hypothetical protein
MLATAAKAQLGAPAAAPTAASITPAGPKKEADKHHIVLMELLAKELGVQVCLRGKPQLSLLYLSWLSISV